MKRRKEKKKRKKKKKKGGKVEVDGWQWNGGNGEMSWLIETFFIVSVCAQAMFVQILV